MEVSKNTGPSFYITSWLSLLFFLSALPCFTTGKGKTENRSLQSPTWQEVFPQQRVLFCVKLFLVLGLRFTTVTKTNGCSITHVEYCEALFKRSSKNYNAKNSYSEFVHASSETMESGEETVEKIQLKKEKDGGYVGRVLFVHLPVVEEFFSMSHKGRRKTSETQ